MLASIVINRRFLNDKNNPNSRHDTIITSTPIKKQTVQQMTMEWLSPVEKTGNKSPKPHVPIQENKKLEKVEEAESVDKICLVNHSPKINNIQGVSALNNVDVGPKITELRQLIVMDSDEEEIFWGNRNKPVKKTKRVLNENKEPSIDTRSLTKKKKTEEQVESINAKPNFETAVNIDSVNHGIIPPKNTVDSKKAVPSAEKRLKKIARPAKLPVQKNGASRSNSALEISKNLAADELLEDSDSSTIIITPLNMKRNKVTEDDENTVRRSNRQRCKPLEFWNGQRMNVDRSFSTGICKTVRDKNNLKTKKVQKVQGSEIEVGREEVEQGDQIPTNTANLANTLKPESRLARRSKTKRKKGSILKSKTSSRLSPRFKANVTFSAIGSGTTIDGPISEINIKPDWMVNFSGLQLAKQPLPDSENCLVYPGLNTAMGIISSGIIKIHPKAINQNEAPDLHHLMFCVMVGTITVTINETSIGMKTYGHFAVPCGVSYSIENIGKKEAILSFFKVACSCIRK